MKEIKVNIWDNNQKDGLQQICDDWSKDSGIKVSIEVVDWDNYWTLLEAGASGGQLADVFWMHSDYYPIMDPKYHLRIKFFLQFTGYLMQNLYHNLHFTSL